MTKTKEIYETICTVDPEWGTVRPSFKLGDDFYDDTSGELKYFKKLKGKKLKITIEVLED